MTSIRRFWLTAAALVVVAVSLSIALSQVATPLAVGIQSSVRVKMRDGVELVADIYRPLAEGKFPVLLERTPYNRSGPGMAHELASNGYVVIRQDVRGRFESGGEFYPFRYESQDGYDTVEWAAGLEGSNGRVGMLGGSYVGATQMLAAMAKPPHLEAIFPYVTAAEYYEGWTYQGGAWMQWFSSSWASGLTVDTLRRKSAAAIRARQWVGGALPVENFPLLEPARDLAPYYRDWIAHESNDEYWRAWKISDHYGEMTVKGLHGAGWHDIFLQGSIGNYLSLRERAGAASARQSQRLLVGPWAHAATSAEGKIGDVTFGTAAVLDMPGTTLRWFNYALKGEQNEYATGAPVRIFVMGDNVWRDEQQFPPARAQARRFYLGSSRGANTAAGDGLLATSAPARGGRPDRYEYDPTNPVASLGGRLCCGAEMAPGPFDQRPNESRQDVLVYSTPALEREMEVTGFVSVELHAASSAVDTDWTALLADVGPDGYARFLTDGIVRARYRNGTTRAEPITPGQATRYTIDLWATSNVFKAGHRIRLYISSSNFPRFNRNLNTGEPTLGATRLLKAQQVIYHDADHPSALVLPVVPRSRGK
ncbi:MAG: CocE/NonD family hydrolase [Acidobacteriota bacterium]